MTPDITPYHLVAVEFQLADLNSDVEKESMFIIFHAPQDENEFTRCKCEVLLAQFAK